MFRIIFIALILILNSRINIAQDYVFKVLASKGDNRFRTTAQVDWKPLKIGISLFEGDRLLTKNEPYIGLIHSSGQTLELLEEGTFTIDQLSSKLDIRKKGIASKYSEYVLQNLNDQDPEKIRKSFDSRGIVDEIHLYLPPTSKVLNLPLVANWSPVEGNHTYLVSVQNMFGENLKQFETDTTQISINWNRGEFGNEKLMVINVALKEDPNVVSHNCGIEWITGEKSQKLKTEEAQLIEEIDLNSPLNHIIMASFYEKNELIIDAMRHYWKAMKLAPEIESYKTIYYAFLVRID